jgi:hypothetical protein
MGKNSRKNNFIIFDEERNLTSLLRISKMADKDLDALLKMKLQRTEGNFNKIQLFSRIFQIICRVELGF